MESEQKKPAARRLVKLFFSMLYISAFTFGGGFVIVTLMKRKFVDELHWMTEEEMLDIAAMAQSSPGAIAVNAANLVGWRVGGFAGMLTSVIATIIPPMADSTPASCAGNTAPQPMFRPASHTPIPKNTASTAPS